MKDSSLLEPKAVETEKVLNGLIRACEIIYSLQPDHLSRYGPSTFCASRTGRFQARSSRAEPSAVWTKTIRREPGHLDDSVRTVESALSCVVSKLEETPAPSTGLLRLSA